MHNLIAMILSYRWAMRYLKAELKHTPDAPLPAWFDVFEYEFKRMYSLLSKGA